MASEFIYAEFDPITLDRFQFPGLNGSTYISIEERDAYIRSALEPGIHALLKQARGKFPSNKRLRIALALCCEE